MSNLPEAYQCKAIAERDQLRRHKESLLNDIVIAQEAKNEEFALIREENERLLSKNVELWLWRQEAERTLLDTGKEIAEMSAELDQIKQELRHSKAAQLNSHREHERAMGDVNRLRQENAWMWRLMERFSSHYPCGINPDLDAVWIETRAALTKAPR